MSILLVNNDHSSAHTLTVPSPAERYTLDAEPLDSKTVRLNGSNLVLGADDSVHSPCTD